MAGRFGLNSSSNTTNSENTEEHNDLKMSAR